MAFESAVQGWHALSVDQALKKLESSFEGLRAAEAHERLDRFGPNKIEEEKPISGWAILFKQLRGFFNIVLYVACAIALFTAQWTDASFITVILVVNTILSFVQEYKASRMMASLKSYVVEEVTVLRDGKPVNLGVTDVVPGDVVLLEEGMRVPADAPRDRRTRPRRRRVDVDRRIRAGRKRASRDGGRRGLGRPDRHGVCRHDRRARDGKGGRVRDGHEDRARQCRPGA